ncbi:MAG: 50S ribosomal protein L9 [Paludibacteraceae bacterium]|jgi:large subunit ribosomal protein L9|nr:50S ribosomal protein L9 [Paludibacteraceae bacterium]MBP3717313.1 50S ribosomal protein L9 [Paludibacteraceae bacterium]MBR6106110.1 50S ribosomal protein L9 [Paludibacteraceae bacterium]
MEIILLEDVNNLGFKNDVVNVKNGYGLNFLIPQGKAILATPSAKKVLAENLKQQAKKLEKIKADAQAKADKLNGVSLTFAVKTSENGSIYGSVTNAQVAEELSKKGVDVDHKIVSIKTPVKALGEYTAVVRFHKEVSVEVPFTVVSE